MLFRFLKCGNMFLGASSCLFLFPAGTSGDSSHPLEPVGGFTLDQRCSLFQCLGQCQTWGAPPPPTPDTHRLDKGLCPPGGEGVSEARGSWGSRDMSYGSDLIKWNTDL